MVPPPPVQTVAVESPALSSQSDLIGFGVYGKPRRKGSGSGSEKGSVQNPEKGSVRGSGSGCQLPDLENIQWESHKKGGTEAWHVPAGAVHRKDKVYLGYVGKRQLAEWSALKPDDLRRVVSAWIQARREGKGVR